ncbi:hypothetical protein H0H87_005246 [Tephrocybe sp. NHM501043]|nr:hypothetical protein H0H87_005246 [Tephrocybe sp. NHM501043]
MLDIKTLLNRASSAIVAGAVTTPQEHAEDDSWPEYEWLYKDAPHHMGRHAICITECWPQEMTIELGRLPPYLSNPVDTLWAVGGRVDFSKPFRLIAKFKQSNGWPLDLGFRRLGEFLAVLAHGEIPYEQWNELNIELPNVAVPYDTAAPTLIPLDALRNLRTLKWSGHRHQLRASWLPFAPAVLQPLTTLHITCDLALQDCMYILFHGTSLKEFKFKISKGFANEPVLPFDASERLCVERPMETLNLTSDDDIVPLLHPFSFPSLRHLKLHLSHPTTSTFHRLDVWKNLDTAFLDCWPTIDDDAWIRSQCPPTVKLTYELGPGSSGSDVRLDFIADMAPPLTQEIIMTLTRMSAQAAATTHNECIQKLRQNLSFGMIARFTHSRDIDWSLSNLEKLGAGFNLLRQYDQLQRFKTMTVELPTTDNISIEDTRTVDGFFLPTVNSLTWTSHRNQLPLFTGSCLNVHRLPLEQLTLSNVEFLLRDCNIILKGFAETLQIFKVEKLIGQLDDASANAIATSPNARVHMIKLHTLNLDSDYSPGHILNDFEFPVLREFSLTTRRSRLSFFKDDFLTLQERWPQITTSTILGDYKKSESQFIQKKLSPGGNHSHRLVAYF